MDITNIANLPNPEAAILETKNIALDGITGEQPVRAIEEALRSTPGVVEVHIDRERRIASVTFDTRHTNFPELHEVLLRSGYRPSRSVPH